MAQVIPAAAASTPARRTGDPCMPSSVRPAMIPPNTTPADSHCAACGAGWPPVGSAAARNTASAPATVSTEAQAAGRICWWIHTRRSTITKISSVISSGWTTDSGPLFRAPACRMYELMPASTAEQPQRLPDQVARQPDARHPGGRCDAGQVLGHQVDRVGQRGAQREHDGEEDHGLLPWRDVRAGDTAGPWLSRPSGR